MAKVGGWERFFIVGVASLLRFWKLDAKPLWGDEIYTAFYSLGKSLADVPAETLLSLDDYWALLSYPPESGPWQAAYAVTTYSNHPPLFFMLMNYWLGWWGCSIWSLRSLPVLFGVVSVAGGYYLGRLIGGAKVGRYTAVLMAVSPYSIYLSQEARHYSLAVAIATFSLLNWLFLLKHSFAQERLDKERLVPADSIKSDSIKSESIKAARLDRSKYHWIAWISLNSLGFWVHYFYVFCIAAQWAIVLCRLWQQRSVASAQRLARQWLGAMGMTLLLCAPLLPTVLSHLQAEGNTSWLSRSIPWWQTLVLPWIQSMAAGVFMLVLLPVEAGSIWVQVLSAIAMLGVFWLVVQQSILGLRSTQLPGREGHRASPKERFRESFRERPLVSYGLCVLTFIFIVTYVSGKDLTVAPRYLFTLYPAVAAIIASRLAHRRWVLGIAIAAGLLSQVFITHNLALLKPYLPGQIGAQLAASSQPTIVLISPPPPFFQSRIFSYIFAIPRRANTLVGLTDSAPSEEWALRRSDIEGRSLDSFTLWLVEVHRQDPFPPAVSLPNSLCLPQGKTLTTQGTKQQQYHCKP
ncbi:MAG: glycosyltransferase family 39 protein [Cyanobacteria bacterium J06560_5]